jgi:hypothetical protein
MALHIIKLCVGCTSIEDLRDWQLEKLAQARKAKRQARLWHRTRMFPKRGEEIIGQGSLYWVIKAVVQVRQPIIDLEAVTGEDGIARCDIVLSPELIPVRPVPRRAFQGWRYLKPEDAPADLKGGLGGEIARMPEAMRAELLSLGLI